MQNSIQKLLPAVSLSLLAAFTFSSCETPGRTAMLGAATGAAIGSQTRAGALRGAAIGAGAGYVAGRVVQSERRRAYEQGLADRDGHYYDNARHYRDGRYYDDRDRVVVRERRYYTAPTYRTRRVYAY
jgi:hypothetical protein